jgi:hypothetical protein
VAGRNACSYFPNDGHHAIYELSCVHTLGAVKLIMHQGQTTTKLTGCKLTPLSAVPLAACWLGSEGDFSQTVAADRKSGQA